MFEATLELRMPNGKIFRIHSPAAYEAPEGSPWNLAAHDGGDPTKAGETDPEFEADDAPTMAGLLVAAGGFERADRPMAQAAFEKMLAPLVG